MKVSGLPTGPESGLDLVPAPVISKSCHIYLAIIGYRERGELVDADRDEGHVHIAP
jgi:hypothetical protein